MFHEYFMIITLRFFSPILLAWFALFGSMFKELFEYPLLMFISISVISFCFSTCQRNAMEYYIINFCTNMWRIYTLFVCSRSFSTIFSIKTCKLEIYFQIKIKCIFIFREHSGIWCSIVINNQNMNYEKNLLWNFREIIVAFLYFYVE